MIGTRKPANKIPLYYARYIVLICCMLVCLTGSSWASRLIVRIQAANPTDTPRTVDVQTRLPERITTNNIIDLAGLDLGYDVKSDTYYVHGALELAPKEVLVRNVELEDIWVVDPDTVLQFGEQANRLAGMLAPTEYGAEGEGLASETEAGVQTILRQQQENRITLVSPIQHIQAYEKNLRVLQQVRQKVGRLENLVLAAGMNPGEALMGEDRMAAPPRREVYVPASYGEAVVQITIRNTSTTQVRRNIEVRRDLPPEVQIEDVLDAGGLTVHFDPQQRVTYVQGTGIALEPSESMTFTVRIRDKWNVHEPRMDFLEELLARLQATISGRPKLEAVHNTLDAAGRRLQAVRAERGPETFGPAYIAFYRRQVERLDAIEHDLNRVDAALRPLDTRRGFDIPAPDRKTTWVLIYAILGFLALISLLFFLRWFVKSN